MGRNFKSLSDVRDIILKRCWRKDVKIKSWSWDKKRNIGNLSSARCDFVTFRDNNVVGDYKRHEVTSSNSLLINISSSENHWGKNGIIMRYCETKQWFSFYFMIVSCRHLPAGFQTIISLRDMPQIRFKYDFRCTPPIFSFLSISFELTEMIFCPTVSSILKIVKSRGLTRKMSKKKDRNSQHCLPVKSRVLDWNPLLLKLIFMTLFT